MTVLRQVSLLLLLALAPGQLQGGVPKLPISEGPRQTQAVPIKGLEEAIGVGGRDASGKQLSPKDRIRLFEEVWRRVNDRYYDPNFHGVDWKGVHDRYLPLIGSVTSDGQLYLLLKRMVGELHDAHTRFEAPEERQDREKLQTLSAGFEIREVGGKPVVMGLVPGSDAERAGIRAGMIVSSVNGVPVSDRLAQLQGSTAVSSTERAERLRLYRRLMGGQPGDKIRLALISRDRTKLEAEIALKIVPDVAEVSSRWLPSGYGYIRLTLWQSPGHDPFRNALAQFSDAPGVVIDLRGNPGGEVDEVLKIAGYFYSSRVSFGEFISRSGKPLELYAGHAGDEAVFRGPLAIIVDESSGSGSEMFSAVMQETGRAVIVGSQSCGCLLGISQYKKVRGGGELAISELGYLSARGRRIEGAGVIPDTAAPITLADLQSNRDSALEDAQGALRAYSMRTRDGRQ